MPSRARLTLVVLALFLLWSNSFVAVSFLLGAERSAARFDFVGLTAARFGLVGAGSALWMVLRRRAETVALLRRHGGRIALCGLLSVIVYNFALNYGQATGVPPPVASLATTLAPLFLVVMGALVLGEALPRRRLAGFLVAIAGLVLVGAARGAFQPGAGRYLVSLLVLAMAPLSFALYTVLSRPLLAGDGTPAGRVDPQLWTFAIFAAGGLPLALLLPFRGGREMLALDLPGWSALAFLSLLCTVVGFLVWVRLVRLLPASAVGLTIFLNPPLTTLSKRALSAAFPATFQFAIEPLEIAGGLVLLGGVALALSGRPRRIAGDVELTAMAKRAVSG